MKKKCTKCNKTKSVKEFSKDKSKKDGLTSACKECNNSREKKRRQNGGDFTKEQKRNAFIEYGEKCQICNSKSNLQVDHKLPQNVCMPNTASVHDNAWVLCKGCNIAKGTRILIEVIQSIPNVVLGPMLLRELANAIDEKNFKTVPITINSKQFTEVKFK